MLVNTAHIREALTPRQSESLFDVPLMYSMLMLIGVGFVMVTSASMPVAERLFDNPYHFTYRHVVFLIGSLILFWFATNVPMTWWKRSNPYLLLFGLVLLVAVLIIGREVNGAKRWIPLGPFGLQVAEASKLFFFSYIAGYLVRKREEVQENIKGFAKPIIVFAAYAFFDFNAARFRHCGSDVCDHGGITVFSRGEIMAVFHLDAHRSVFGGGAYYR